MDRAWQLASWEVYLEDAAVLPMRVRRRLYSCSESMLNEFAFHIIKYAKDSFHLFQAKKYTGIINMCVCSSSAVQHPQFSV